MYEIRISASARNDLNDSFFWYENKQKELGNEFLKEVFQTLASISENPFLFPVRFSQKFRFGKITRFPYLIVYEFFENQIIVNAIFHTSRNPLRF